jgi:hypothetical protein
MFKTALALGVLVFASMFLVVPAAHAQLSGAIFTTVANGSEVNFNIYPNKDAVYLDGGPGPGAPQAAAGLPDGTYVFMVTDPSGKTLLSTDAAGCRRFTVAAGIITGVVDFNNGSGNCKHVTGTDVDHNAVTVQLMPYNDTPNNGGEYKAWATPVGNYLCNSNWLTVDCSLGKHGFVNRYSKTDNFKVKVTPIVEIDTRFHDVRQGGAYIDGAGITWIDTLGASNNKWSYYRPDLYVNHEAHVESPEPGAHQIVIQPQALCTSIGEVYVQGQFVGLGPQTVNVRISPNGKSLTVFVDVYCY